MRKWKEKYMVIYRVRKRENDRRYSYFSSKKCMDSFVKDLERQGDYWIILRKWKLDKEV